MCQWADCDELRRPQDRRRAKYELLHTERTLLTTDVAFNSIKVLA